MWTIKTLKTWIDLLKVLYDWYTRYGISHNVLSQVRRSDSFLNQIGYNSNIRFIVNRKYLLSVWGSLRIYSMPKMLIFLVSDVVKVWLMQRFVVFYKSSKIQESIFCNDYKMSPFIRHAWIVSLGMITDTFNHWYTNFI